MGNNEVSKIPEPHEIHHHAWWGGCVKGEITSTEAGSEDKGYMGMRRGERE